MQRVFLLVLAATLLIVGCAQPQMPMGPPEKPDPAPEMAKLGVLIGTWTDVAEMLSRSPSEMCKEQPEGTESPPSTFKGSYTWASTLDGMFIRCEGWHEMGPGQRMSMVEYYTWDPKAKKYRGRFFSDWGEHGDAWMTLDADGKTFRFTGETKNAQGVHGQGSGTMTLVDDRTIEWTWKENGPHGKMEFKGTSRRQ